MVELEQSIADQLNKELSALPAKYGFADVQSFVAAVEAASGRRRRGRPAKKSAKAAKPARGGKRRKRAVITDDTRAKVKTMVNDGKTGAEIAKALSISLPSVQNIKKALGLVNERKK